MRLQAPRGPAAAGWSLAPGPSGTRSATPLVIGAVVAVLVLATLVGVLLHRTSATSTTAATQVAAPVPTASAPADAGTSGSAPTAATDTSTSALSTPDQNAQALQQLQQLRQQDLPTVTFSGQYVAQLASKYDGIVDPRQAAMDGSPVFHARDILAEHEALRNADNGGATVILLLSTDYGSQQVLGGQALWVTFAVSNTFGSAQDVTTWCANRFPNLSGDALTNVCTPAQLNPPHG